MFDPVLTSLMRDQQIPGLACALHRGDALVYEGYHGLANVEHGVPVTAESVFEIASVTKLFTTQAILRLAQDKRLTLDDPIHTYVPGLPDAWRGVTLLHILTHQSGIPNYTDPPRYWEITREEKSLDQILALVRDQPLKFAPGERHSYDNTGFYLLGTVIERAAGMPYAEYLKQTIFDPLGMTQTRTNDYAAVIPHRAHGYDQKDGVIVNKPYYSVTNTFSAGNIVSTVRDLLTWRACLYNDSVLDADMRRLWWTPHPSRSANERAYDFTVGVGWFMVDSPFGTFYGHNGGIQGFASTFMYYPLTGTTVIVLVNSSRVTEPHKIAFAMLQHKIEM